MVDLSGDDDPTDRLSLKTGLNGFHPVWKIGPIGSDVVEDCPMVLDIVVIHAIEEFAFDPGTAIVMHDHEVSVNVNQARFLCLEVDVFHIVFKLEKQAFVVQGRVKIARKTDGYFLKPNSRFVSGNNSSA